MTVESNYVISIATLSDWLQRLAPVFQPMRRKTKTKTKSHHVRVHDFSRASSELHVIAKNCDWFMELSVPVVIVQSDYFGFGFSTVI